MEKLVLLLPVLGCAAMMAMMMWMMMRGRHDQTGPAAGDQPAGVDAQTAEEIAMLRAEVAALRAQQRQQSEQSLR